MSFIILLKIISLKIIYNTYIIHKKNIINKKLKLAYYLYFHKEIIFIMNLKKFLI